MTEPLPENIRRAGHDALEELANRMSRGAMSLYRHAARLRSDEPKSHHEALGQLRRYQGFGMPCFEEVAKIEGALTGLTEPESRALTERRRIEKSRRERAEKEQRAESWEENWQQGGWRRRETLRSAKSRAAMLSQAASYVEKNVGGVDLEMALARCLDAKMADQDPFCDLADQFCQIGGHRQAVANSADNVVPLWGDT